MEEEILSIFLLKIIVKVLLKIINALGVGRNAILTIKH